MEKTEDILDSSLLSKVIKVDCLEHLKLEDHVQNVIGILINPKWRASKKLVPKPVYIKSGVSKMQ